MESLRLMESRLGAGVYVCVGGGVGGGGGGGVGRGGP